MHPESMLVTTYLCHFYISIVRIRTISPRTVPDYIGQQSLPSSDCSFSLRSMSLFVQQIIWSSSEGWMKEEDTELLTKIYRALNDLAYNHPPNLNLIIFFPLFIFQPYLTPSFSPSNKPFLKIFTGTGKVTEKPSQSLTSPPPQRLVPSFS